MIRKILVCTLVLLLLSAGCAPAHLETTKVQGNFDLSEPMPEFDAQNQYLFATSLSFQETEDFFCGSTMAGNFLHYYDKASGVSGMLCADPACLHDSSDCSAYAAGGANLSIYDGKRYWIAGDPQEDGNDAYLWCSDLSGSNRKKVKRISFDDVILTYQPQLYVVHRGMLYIQGDAEVVQDGANRHRVTLLSTPLDSSEKFTVLMDEVIPSGHQITTRFVGNVVYVSFAAFQDDGPLDLTITRYDGKTGAAESVYTEKGMTEMPGQIWVTDTGELYLSGADEHHSYLWKIENGMQSEVTSWQTDGMQTPFITDGIAVKFSLRDDVRYADIVDLSGNVLYSGKLFPEEIPGLEGDPNQYAYAFAGGDADKLILNLIDLEESGTPDYTVMLDLHENLKPTLLWSSRQ